MQIAVAPRVAHSTRRQKLERCARTSWNRLTAAMAKAIVHSRLSLMSKKVSLILIAFMFAYTLFGSPLNTAQRTSPNNARPRPASMMKRDSSTASSRVRNDSTSSDTSGAIQTMFEKPDTARMSASLTSENRPTATCPASSRNQARNQGRKLQGGVG